MTKRKANRSGQQRRNISKRQKQLTLASEDQELATVRNRASEMWRQGQLAVSKTLYQTVLAKRPNDTQSLNGLALILSAEGNSMEAEQALQRALKVDAASLESLNNYAILLRGQGRLNEAQRIASRAVAENPESPAALVTLGTICQRRDDLQGASEAFAQAAELAPQLAAVQNNLGLIHRKLGRLAEAEKHVRQALVLEPNMAEAHTNLGNILRANGQLDEALLSHQQALQLSPDLSSAHRNLGLTYASLGNKTAAQASLQSAAQLAPHDPDSWYQLGALQVEHHEFDLAITTLSNALSLAPQHVAAGQLLAISQHRLGAHAAALGQLEQTLAGDADHLATRLRHAALQPVIPTSSAELLRERQRLRDELQQLVDAPDLPTCGSPDLDLGIIPFEWGYQGVNDREDVRTLAQLHRRVVPSLNFETSDLRCQPASKIRVGFLSEHFYSHTISDFTKGIMAQLDRSRFEVTAFTFAGQADDTTSELEASADRAVRLPKGLQQCREQLADAELDVLFFADIGMRPISYYLAFGRYAPVQCTTWGHPVTTGIDTVDYYLSADSIEPSDADGHYTEKLVRLSRLPTYFYQPSEVDGEFDWAANGCDAAAAHIVCPQSLFKLHPDNDGLFAQLLDVSPTAELVLLEGMDQWTKRVRRRLEPTLGAKIERLRFVPRQNTQGFHQLLRSANLMIDPMCFGGGKTTYECFAMGTPIVTLPGTFMRSRVTLGCYRQMGWTDLVVDTVEQYVSKVSQLVNDPHYAASCRAEIRARREFIFEDADAVRAIEDFFTSCFAS